MPLFLCLLKYFFHTYFLRFKPHSLIKLDRRRITAPHIQRNIIATAFHREIRDIFIQALSDMLSALRFIYTKVVDIKCLYIREYITALVILKNTESIS